MANFTTSTPTTNDPANIYGLLGVGTDNEGKLLDPDALLAAGGATNLGYTASPTQGVVTSDTGNDATIPAADGTNAGLFLPAEKTKLSGIAAGAEVNVNADWNAVSGDAQILNKPTVTTNHTALSNIGTNTHTQIDSHIASTTNPHSVTKTQIGLGNVVNSDTTTTANITDSTDKRFVTDAEKTKLSGIAAGAEVNVNADWNAVSGDAQILNKPTVTTDHTALSNIGTNTHAQIDTAIGTIFSKVGDTLTGTAGSGFFGAIPQSSAPSTPGSGFRIYANASGLLEWKGTNGFTRTFDGSANTANRAYTLPNSSGTIAVEGSLTTFANPSIQNGYYRFVQTTAPTQRSSGVPLVTGDRWYNPSTYYEAVWNGTYWLSKQQYSTGEKFPPIGIITDPATTPGLRYLTPSAGAELVFVKFCWVYRTPAGADINLGDASNHELFRWGYHNVNTTSFTNIHQKASYTIDNPVRYRFDVNTAYTVTGLNVLRSFVGTGSNANCKMGLTYQIIL